jgi:hypothetical protein
MAGQALHDYSLNGVPDSTIIISSCLEADAVDHAVFVAPFDLVIEKASVRYPVAVGSTSTATLRAHASGVADDASDATSIQVGSGVNMNSGTDTNHDFTIDTDKNVILAGDAVMLRMTAAGSATFVTTTVTCSVPR